MKCFLLIVALVALVTIHGYKNAIHGYRRAVSQFMTVDERSYNSRSPMKYRRSVSMMSMMATEEAPTATSTPPSTSASKTDFSKLVVGTEYDAKLLSAKQFGVFVDISVGTNVLLPRSLLSRGSFERLKKMVESKSQETIRIELASISAENQTLSGKYLPPNYKKERNDLSSLKGKDLSSKMFNATIISAHDFGLFAELEEFGVEGLIPASKLPMKLPAGSIQASYPAGSSVQVKIDNLNVDDKKLVLSMRSSERAEVDAFVGVPPNRWLQAIVQSVTSYGLFVRPAGYDAVGLLRPRRVPRDLIAALKKKAPMDNAGNKTDVEMLFSEGDVIKCRIDNVDAETKKLELSMLPYRSDDDNDDYVVEGRDPEGDEDKPVVDNSSDEDFSYDAEDTLLWWRGSRYVKSGKTDTTNEKDEDTEILQESSGIVEGTWRRMFELDMREDAADFSSKAIDMELKELADEIGELSGLDDELFDPVGVGAKTKLNSLGSYIVKTSMPSEWSEELEFFKEVEVDESAYKTKLRGGKTAEQEEFEQLLKEVEMELDQASKAPKRSAPAPDEPIAKVVAEDEVAEASNTDGSDNASE